MEMLSNVRGSVPIIFLVTDGAVEDERHICDTMKNYLRDGRPICPRIFTFGIGNGFCFIFILCLEALCWLAASRLFRSISDIFTCDVNKSLLLLSISYIFYFLINWKFRTCLVFMHLHLLEL